MLTKIVNLYLTKIVKNYIEQKLLDYAMEFIKYNFTHKPSDIWVLLMCVVPNQDNISLNYNPLFQGKTL